MQSFCSKIWLYVGDTHAVFSSMKTTQSHAPNWSTSWWWLFYQSCADLSRKKLIFTMLDTALLSTVSILEDKIHWHCVFKIMLCKRDRLACVQLTVVTVSIASKLRSSITGFKKSMVHSFSFQKDGLVFCTCRKHCNAADHVIEHRWNELKSINFWLQLASEGTVVLIKLWTR